MVTDRSYGCARSLSSMQISNGMGVTLILSAKANGHEPYRYLRHVFKELPAADSVEAIEALLPFNLDAESLT